MSLAGLDESKLKAIALAMWRRGGMDTLVKVMPKAAIPSAARQIGYCTTFKFIAGRTPIEMEYIVGLRENTKLVAGAAIFIVTPLPAASGFSLRGYTQTPEGVSTHIKAPHPDYPPGAGAPQWELHSLQSALRPLAVVEPGQRFSFPVHRLPPAS